MLKPLTPQIKLKHRIYKVSPDGLLKERKLGVFDDFDSLEAAQTALLNSNEHGEYVVLPVLLKTYE